MLPFLVQGAWISGSLTAPTANPLPRGVRDHATVVLPSGMLVYAPAVSSVARYSANCGLLVWTGRSVRASRAVFLVPECVALFVACAGGVVFCSNPYYYSIASVETW